MYNFSIEDSNPFNHFGYFSDIFINTSLFFSISTSGLSHQSEFLVGLSNDFPGWGSGLIFHSLS